MKSKHYLLIATALVTVIFVSGNLLAQKVLTGAQIDFTENHLYSLSKATREKLSDIAEPVDVTLVYSRSVAQDYPAVRAYAARVRELLKAYESQSGGYVRVREIDPTPFSPAEDEALAAGITAIDTNGDDPLYFGIIGHNTIDDQRVIPFLAPEREVSLEYDLTRMVSPAGRSGPAACRHPDHAAGHVGAGRTGRLHAAGGYRPVVRHRADLRSVPVAAG